MKLNEYQEKAMSTCLPSSDNFSYMMFGLVEEVGELAGKISKAIRKQQVSIGVDVELASQMREEDVFANDIYFLDDASELRGAIKKELGDVMWMVAGLCNQIGWTLEEVCQENLDKLADRAKRGKIEGNGDDR